MIKGIDVSHHNGEINWQRVKAAGMGFAMLRACFGWDNDSQIDRQLQNNIQGCEKTALPYGFYHYSYAMNPEEARKEAAFFLRVIAGTKPLYPVAFDFEEKTQLELPLEMQLSIIEAFLGEIEKAGYYGSLYMSASPMEQLYRYAPERIRIFDCWVANIGVSRPSFSGNYGMWQYSWNGKINGINGNVDLDYSYKDYESIIKSMNVINGTINPNPSIDETTDSFNKQFDKFSKELLALVDKYKKIIK